MRITNILISILAAMLISGCANNLRFQDSPPATQNESINYSINSTIKSESEIFSQARTITPTSPIYYYQNYGGGGVIVGALFGPIGVLTNMAMINSNTDNDIAALSGKISLDPIEITKQAITQNEKFVESKSPANDFLISPYIIIVKGDNESLHFSSVVDVASGAWKGRYSYHLASRLPLSKLTSGLSPAEASKIKADIEHGFQQALALFESDIAGTLQPMKEISFYSEPVSPRIKMIVPAKLIKDENNEVVVLGPGGADQFSFILSSGYHKLRKSDADISAR